MSKVLKQVTEKISIARIKTSPYHPQSNGSLERFHSTLKSVLKKCCENKRDWTEVLDLALYYLRNMPHRISGFTPFELQFGKETPHILATLKSYWLDSENIPINVTDFMLNLQIDINTVMEAPKSRLQNAHAKAREKSDQVKLRVLNVGDLVLWKTPGLSKSLSTS